MRHSIYTEVSDFFRPVVIADKIIVVIAINQQQRTDFIPTAFAAKNSLHFNAIVKITKTNTDISIDGGIDMVYIAVNVSIHIFYSIGYHDLPLQLFRLMG